MLTSLVHSKTPCRLTMWCGVEPAVHFAQQLIYRTLCLLISYYITFNSVRHQHFKSTKFYMITVKIIPLKYCECKFYIIYLSSKITSLFKMITEIIIVY